MTSWQEKRLFCVHKVQSRNVYIKEDIFYEVYHATACNQTAISNRFAQSKSLPKQMG